MYKKPGFIPGVYLIVWTSIWAIALLATFSFYTPSSLFAGDLTTILPIEKLPLKEKWIGNFEYINPIVRGPLEIPRETKKTLDEVSSRLNLALNTVLAKRYPGIPFIDYELRVVNSNVSNAFVVTVQTKAKKRANLVYLTSEMVEELAGATANSNEFKKAVTGLLAHEFGHTFGTLDKLGGATPMSRYERSQLVEFATDQEAIGLLREAGYPTDALHFALQHTVHPIKKNYDDVLDAAVDTHPQDDIRRSAQRLGITYDRLTHGSQETVQPLKGNSALDKELSLIRKMPRHSAESTDDDRSMYSTEKPKTSKQLEDEEKNLKKITGRFKSYLQNHLGSAEELYEATSMGRFKDKEFYYNIRGNLADIIAFDAIEESTLSLSQKTAIEDKYFLNLQVKWLVHPDYEKILNHLVSVGSAKDLLEVFEKTREQMRKLESVREAFKKNYHTEMLKIATDRIEKEISQISKNPNLRDRMNLLRRWSQVFENGVSDGKITSSPFGGPEMAVVDAQKDRRLKIDRRIFMQQFSEKMLHVLQEIKPTPDIEKEFIATFQNIAAFGSTVESDRVYASTIEPIIISKLRSPDTIKQGTQLATEFLTKEYLEDQNAKIKLAKAVLDAENYTKNGLKTATQRIQELLPFSSSLKDNLLEETLWKIGALDRSEIEFVEMAKSTNAMNVDGTIARHVSALADGLRDLAPEERIEAARYLVAQGKVPMSEHLAMALAKHIERRTGKPHLGRAFVNSFRSFALTSHENEKIPVFEFLLEGGETSLSKNPKYHSIVLNEMLGYVPGSTEEKLLSAYLRIVPHEEVGPTLAYLLSRQGEGKRSIKPVFEVFQTVGIKAGQLSELWKLLPADMNEELKTLKDSATPMTMSEIDKILRNTLSPSELNKIKGLKTILGSASVKTVVEAELKDGRRVVLLVQRTHADALIRSNLMRARRFIQELSAVNIPFDKEAALQLLNVVEDQLKLELSFRREAQLMDKFKEVFEGKMNKDLQAKLRGWRFHVPTPLKEFKRYDNLLVVEKAPGNTINKLSPAIKQEVGPAITEGSIRGLFEDGIFNPDLHAGNVLADFDSKTISLIDIGQGETFSHGSWDATGLFKDESFELAQLLRGLGERDSSRIVENILKLSGHTSVPKVKVALLKQNVADILKLKSDAKTTAIELMNMFAKEGYPLNRKTSVGAMKGLLVLSQEGYVTPEELQKISEESISKKIRSRPIRALYEETQGNTSERCEKLFIDIVKRALYKQAVQQH